jgi:hypothetical protein
MGRLKLRKAQREIIDTIKEEGALIIAIRKGGSHLLCDYTFDRRLFFVATMPSGTSISPRWIANFRTQLRGNRGSKS